MKMQRKYFVSCWIIQTNEIEERKEKFCSETVCPSCLTSEWETAAQPSRKDTLGTVLPVAEISLKTVKMTYFDIKCTSDSLLKFFFVGLVCLSSVVGKHLM